MKQRRRRSPVTNHDRWLVSYADFITLLFAFFVVLYSSAQVDHRRVGKLAVAIQQAFQDLGAFPTGKGRVLAHDMQPPPEELREEVRNTVYDLMKTTPMVPAGKDEPDLSELQQELEQTLAQQIEHDQVNLRPQVDGLAISLRELGFFDSGSAQIQPSAEAALDKIATLLARRNYRVRIEGHTDNRPIRSSQFHSNWELSTARATEIVRLFIVSYGFAPDRLCAGGYAEYHPVASNDTAEGQAQNRRVDIVVLGRASPKVMPPPAP